MIGGKLFRQRERTLAVKATGLRAEVCAVTGRLFTENQTMKSIILIILTLAQINLAQNAVLDSAPHTLEFRTADAPLGGGVTNIAIGSFLPVPGYRWKTNQVVSMEPLPPMHYYYCFMPNGTVEGLGQFESDAAALAVRQNHCNILRRGMKEHNIIIISSPHELDFSGTQTIWQRPASESPPTPTTIPSMSKNP